MVQRPRITDRIRSASPSDVVVLSAPIGYGATTAVAHALQSEASVAWVSLESRDADPMALATQVVSAAAGDSAVPAAPWEDPGLAVLETLAAGDVAWLVLDGLDTRAHANALPLVGELCTATPVRVVITSHDEVRTLPVPLLSGQLVSMSRLDLALRPDEAQELLTARRSDLDSAIAQEVVAMADGWTAVVAAAGSTSAAASDLAAWIRESMADDLVTAALRTVPAHARRLLVDTAFLDVVSASLCDTVLTRTDSGRLLEALSLHGGLLEPLTPCLDGEPRWGRHPLLLRGLRRRADPEPPERHRQAAQWHADRDDVIGTMHHLLSAGDTREAGVYLTQRENAVFESGGARRAARWYAALPSHTWGESGWDLLRTGWSCALSGDVRTAEATWEKLRGQILDRTGGPDDGLTAEAVLLGGYLAGLRADVDAMIVDARQALGLQGPRTPVNSLQLAPLIMIRGLLWRGDLVAVRQHLERAQSTAFASDILRESVLVGLRARWHVGIGEVSRAAVLARQAEDWLRGQNLDPVAVSQFGVLAARAQCELESAAVPTAIAMLQDLHAAAGAAGYVGDAVDALVLLIRAHAVRGTHRQAQEVATQARDLLQTHAPESSFGFRVRAHLAWSRLLAGDTLRAGRLIQSLPEGEERSLLWARMSVAHHAGSVQRALNDLAVSTPRHTIERLILLAECVLTRRQSQANDYLLQAADLAGAVGLRLALRGSSAGLLQRAVLVGTRSGHDVLVELAEAARGGRDSEAHPADSATGPALSGGEIQLLEFLPLRDGNSELADRLGVSVNTVKTRLQRLYRKLGASSRDEAIDIARRRGLIP